MRCSSMIVFPPSDIDETTAYIQEWHSLQYHEGGNK